MQHNYLYKTASAFNVPKWHREFQAIWLSNDMSLQRLNGPDLATAVVRVEQDNLWEAGNIYAAQALNLARMSLSDAMEMDMGRNSAFFYVAANGISPLGERYIKLMNALVDRANSNLNDLGNVALVFLCLNVDGLLPLALWLIHQRSRAVLRVRAGPMAILASVPRGLLSEMSKRPVHLESFEYLDEEEEEDSDAKNARDAAAHESRMSAKAMRLLLAQRLDFERVTVCRDQVLSQRSKQRSQWRVEFCIMTPLVTWAAIAALFYGVTYSLQAQTVIKMEPTRAAYIMVSYTARTMARTADLLINGFNGIQGSAFASPTAPIRTSLVADRMVARDAVSSLIWGGSNLTGHTIPTGTVFWSQTLLDYFFAEECFSLVTCPVDSDPNYPSLHRGFYALMIAYFDQLDLIANDADDKLVPDNARYQWIVTNGQDSVRNGQTQLRSQIDADGKIITTIEAIHAMLLVFTVLTSVSFAVLLLRPMEHLLAMESRRLSFLMAELPQELGIEEVAVKLAEEALHSSQDEANLMDMTEAGEATTGEAQGGEGASTVDGGSTTLAKKAEGTA